MKVIKDNYSDFEKQHVCEHCNSVFVFNEEDLRLDVDGEDVVYCPCCGRMNYVTYRQLYRQLTKDNIEFPKSFYQFGVCDGAVKIDDKEITFWIKDCINWLKDNKLI